MTPLNRQGLSAFSDLLQQLYSVTAVSFAEHLHQVLAQHFCYDAFRYEDPERTVSRRHPDNRSGLLQPSRSGLKNRLRRQNRQSDPDVAQQTARGSPVKTGNTLASQVQPRRFEIVISSGSQAELQITLTRFNRDFSRSERAWMDLLGPHLGQLHRTLTAPRSGPAPLNPAGRSDNPLFMSPGASPLSAFSAALSSASPGSAVLERLGLTAREAEVLFWVSRGKTNDEIAIILNISNRTVGKHMEHIAHKLNVETRTSAAAIALEMLALSPFWGSPSSVPFTRTTRPSALKG